jgi:hypothetical protein
LDTERVQPGGGVVPAINAAADLLQVRLADTPNRFRVDFKTFAADPVGTIGNLIMWQPSMSAMPRRRLPRREEPIRPSLDAGVGRLSLIKHREEPVAQSALSRWG